MSNKQFSERLNKELDKLGVPTLTSERVEIFARLIKVRRFKAQELLNGIVLPNSQELETITLELGVNSAWLIRGLGEETDKAH